MFFKRWILAPFETNSATHKWHFFPYFRALWHRHVHALIYYIRHFSDLSTTKLWQRLGHIHYSKREECQWFGFSGTFDEWNVILEQWPVQMWHMPIWISMMRMMEIVMLLDFCSLQVRGQIQNISPLCIMELCQCISIPPIMKINDLKNWPR